MNNPTNIATLYSIDITQKRVDMMCANVDAFDLLHYRLGWVDNNNLP